MYNKLVKSHVRPFAKLRITHGFDASKGEYCDMVKRGIIDPTKVVRTAITDSCGVASLMITTEAMIVEVKEEGAGP